MKKRRNRSLRLSWILTALGLISAVICLVILLVPTGERSVYVPEQRDVRDYEDFLDALGFRESTDNYTRVNSYGYMGRYQMGGSALEEAGFKDEGGNWTVLANSFGIYSKKDFLHSPEGQEYAIRAYHKKVCRYIRYYDLEQYIGTTYCGVKVTRSGLLAACHLVGIGSMKKALASGALVRDGYGTPATEYLELFGGYDISEVWRGENR